MNINQISKEDLINSGAHFGHPVSKWNPNYKQFIVTKKNGIHIINVNHTIDYLQKAVKKISKIIQSDGNILYVTATTSLYSLELNQIGSKYIK